MKIDTKSAQNASKFGFWCILGSFRASKVTQEPPKATQKRPQEGSRAPLATPRDAPRASSTAPKTLASPFVSPNAVGSACGSIFDRFSVNDWKLQSAFRIGFNCTRCRTFCALIARHVEKSRKNNRLGFENRGLGRAGEVRRSKFEAKYGQVERESASEVPPKIF